MTDREALARFICAAMASGGARIGEQTWRMYETWKRLCKQAEREQAVSTGMVHEYNSLGEDIHIELDADKEAVIELEDVFGC
jgi:hypothetical protein